MPARSESVRSWHLILSAGRMLDKRLISGWASSWRGCGEALQLPELVLEVEMSERVVSSADGVSLPEAIGLFRNEVLRARAAVAASDIQLPVESMTVHPMAATRTVAAGRVLGRDRECGAGGRLGWRRETMRW